MDTDRNHKLAARKSARQLVLVSALLGALLGFGAGLVASEYIGTRIVVYPQCGSGIEV
jgi:hypothetical protein